MYYCQTHHQAFHCQCIRDTNNPHQMWIHLNASLLHRCSPVSNATRRDTHTHTHARARASERTRNARSFDWPAAIVRKRSSVCVRVMHERVWVWGCSPCTTSPRHACTFNSLPPDVYRRAWNNWRDESVWLTDSLMQSSTLARAKSGDNCLRISTETACFKNK